MDDPIGDQVVDSDVNSKRINVSDHQIPGVPQVTESLPDEAQFEEPVASPEVIGEEDASGDAPEGEPVDIDAQLESIGRDKDHD
ncbi:hypothetical protein A3A60_04050 [Candidatus Curtissbacteria bacterium RIFCSPLOWO2_01_FULL_42_26]|uniref:Uncharacterized protein n=1 Tax=Candidatus Curtissbacteria bacterium RIFCSPLOWO2_01_FULL_42_26 TaxID=1797729 RepID=A0A1F5HYR5_9BACT|nr:MAG: hypothetical protein A3A60_04050 [Candidatus Curtissbacteria bacterium RIFCSPLOWO2_01_FULL_42_26]